MIESYKQGHPKTILGCPLSFKPVTEPVSTRPAASPSSFRLPAFSVPALVSVADVEQAAPALLVQTEACAAAERAGSVSAPADYLAAPRADDYSAPAVA
jgi:hypothetical protein